MQDFSDVFEACRVHTVRCLLRDIKRSYPTPTAILDCGCGEGRYIGGLREYWPDAPIIGCDISEAGLQIAAQRYAAAQFVVMEDVTVTLPDASVDLVTCIEVIEHVQSAARASQTLRRTE
jgi:ubiquinone/menaquinone biosynthesis C-methylase UbiE